MNCGLPLFGYAFAEIMVIWNRRTEVGWNARMNMHRPASIYRRGVFSGILTMVSDIAGTLAQFLPMKSVFILAADEIPIFFPPLLIEAGSILTALALVAAAAVMAVFSKVTKNLALSFAVPSQILSASSGAGYSKPNSEDSSGGKGSVTVKELSSLILLAVLVGVSAAVSITLVLLVGLWVGVSAAILAMRVHRGARKPPYPNGRVEFDVRFKKWMTDSAVWAVVGAAIVTLIVAFPALGLTGILLGAVLLRRAQQAVPDVVPWVMARFSPVNESGTTHHELSRPIFAPYDFLATKSGARLLKMSLKALNYGVDTWQVCAQPTKSQMTIACKHLESGTVDLIRLFPPNSERAREREWALRHDFQDFFPSCVESMSLETIAGMPAIILKFSKEHQPLLDDPVIPQEAMDWQLNWEIYCAESESVQQALADFEVPDPRDFLYPLLHTASRMNGPHTEPVRLLLENFDRLRSLYLEAPKVLSVGGPIPSQNLVRLSSGKIDIVNLVTWRVRLLGSQWGSSAKWMSELGKKVARQTASELINTSTVGLRVNLLARALKTQESRKIQVSAHDVCRQIL